MFEDIFVQLVAGLAVVYALISYYIQSKLIDRKEVTALQLESKELSDELSKAQKSGNKAKTDELLQKQLDLLPRMNKMMFNQFKPMILVLLILFCFSAFVAYINPYVKDDISISMIPNGLGCNNTPVGVGVFSACFSVPASNYSRWTYAASVSQNGKEVGHNTTEFFIGPNGIPDVQLESAYDSNPPQLWTDKKTYLPGQNMTLYAIPQDPNSNVTAILDNGTQFEVVLPITLPFFNAKAIHQPYWWFILISFISSIIISFATGRFKSPSAPVKP